MLALDTTRAVVEGIEEIVETLLIAIVLVVLVVFVFLQGWRATLIPLLAVPVSLVGTFIFFPALRVLDQHHFALRAGAGDRPGGGRRDRGRRSGAASLELGLAPKEAALKAMEEISAPVVGIALVLSAVFVPTAFIPGITGRLYQQFALTIADFRADLRVQCADAQPSAGGIAAETEDHAQRRPVAQVLRLVQPDVRARDQHLREDLRRGASQVRRSGVRHAARLRRRRGVLQRQAPVEFPAGRGSGLSPSSTCSCPAAASQERTERVARKIEAILKDTPGVQSTTSVVGFSLLSFTRSTYNAFFWVTLKPWGRADEPRRTVSIHQGDAEPRALSQIPEGIAFNFSPPAIPGVGTSGGFTFVLEDRAGRDVQFLASNLDTFLTAARKRPEIGSISTTFLRQRAAAVHPRRSRQGDQAGRGHQRRLPDGAGVHGRAVHQLFQSLRPAVAGLCPGRGRVSDQRGERRAVLREEHGTA